MTGTPPRRRFPFGPPALASLLLHVGAALVLAALHRADPLPTAAPERGVEIVWQDSPEDAAPGEGAEASPESAEAASQEAPAEPEQDAAQAQPPRPPPPPPEAAPEEPRPEPPPPPLEADLAEAPSPEAELPPLPPVEPPPPQVAEAPRPPAADPAETRPVPPPEDAQALDLPLPPPPAPEPPRFKAVRDAPPQALAAARQLPPGPAAASEPPPGGSRATGAVSPPSLLDGVRNPEPEYPLINRQRGDQGVVLVLLRVSETGQVVEVEVIGTSGHPALDASARHAVQRWRFRPAMRDGMPVAGTIRTAIHFRLR